MVGTVVITGASRGLGLASATHLYQQGWRVVAAVRTVEAGLERLRTATGAPDGDPRLVGVRLDLRDRASVAAAADAILDAVGAPEVLVHNAGIAVAGCAEELPAEVWQDMFATHLFGPVALTNALLPSMREARRGRIVVVSSLISIRGFPGASPYSAAKSALERWAEALASEISPLGLGVTVLVTGTFDTEIITDAIDDYRDFDGPYAVQNQCIDRRGRSAIRFASPPERFARGLSRALRATGPYVRRPVGADARLTLIARRLLPDGVLHQVVRLAMGLPRAGSIPEPSTTIR
ncbi:SDR family NAD(P)-dependent oxidoreductase [Cryptosporangium aurantiacum]|uniref:NADP-dependent 3-hydroxy acid dehydrogenase YdfG n=1 Tax=Cryptosporangium aurantiacum TaxID=134849 RepID=A0A1M7Q1Z9_9ACTN|nr:SDR family NAD(P)-dependent oxidoreductase [Cryptosporangium aurantiacum]SHN24132.1 NADP-dependent 3-hydroxy acid dehydrogenase YdfG [Cryptosporangium aurantiacum]